MIVVMSRLRLKRGMEKHFEERFAQRARLADKAEGFISLDVLRGEEKGEYVVMSRWRSRKDFEAWLQSPAFDSAHSGTPSSLAEKRPEVEIYEVVEISAGSEEDKP